MVLSPGARRLTPRARRRAERVTWCTVSAVKPSVLPVASRALVDSCRRLGLDVARLLAAARIEPATLEDPDARLTAEQADAIWREAWAASGDPLLALRA